MEISDYGTNLSLSGPYDPQEADALIAAIQDKNVVSVHVLDHSADEEGALAELLLNGLNPWLENTDRKINLFVTSNTFPYERFALAPRIQVVAVWRSPD